MKTIRVLFVDDDAAVLDSLRSLLRRRQREWEMEFVSSGSAALALIEQEPFDAIVTDMQMPEMNGVALLEQVKRCRPQMARLILSGHAGQTEVVRSLTVAHRFLSKPCDARVLVSVIESTLRLQGLLADSTLRSFVGRLAALPAAPETYLRLTRAVGSEHITTAEMAAIVESDPAIAVKVLQFVNSAFFGLARPVTSIQQAIGYIGIELLTGVVLSAYVFDASVPVAPAAVSLTTLRTHALTVARMARTIAGPAHAELAFAAGVVHDIGKIVLGVSRPDLYSRVLRAAGDGRGFYAAEREMGRVTHAEIGAYLLSLWGLPFDIVEATAFHHTPREVRAGNRRVLAVLHVADLLAQGRRDDIDQAFLEEAGVLAELPAWLSTLDSLAEAAA